MDADLIRLILLLLGIALVAGIWLWDRWQRSRGEPPMAQRDTDVEPETDWEEVESPDYSELADDDFEAEPEPEPEPLLGAASTSEPDAEPVLGAAPEPAAEAPLYLPPDSSAEPEALPEPLFSAAPKRPELPEVKRQPAWLQSTEPRVPAFVMASDDDLDAARVPEQQAEPVIEPRAPGGGQDVDAHDMPSLLERAVSRFAEPGASAEAEAGPALVVDRDHEPDIPVLELEVESIHAPARPARAKTKEPPAKPRVEAEPVTIRIDEDQFDLDLGFSAMDEQDLQQATADLPQLIVQINVVAKRGQPFTGEQILAAMDQVELRAGEHDIFHRLDNRARAGGKPSALFSVASMVEPGSFPLKKMKDFTTPGLTLFAQLPGPRDGLLVYSDMLYVAERLARLLDGRLKDEQRSTLTKQTIEHTRERVAEHKRQVTLRLRQAADRQRGRR